MIPYWCKVLDGLKCHKLSLLDKYTGLDLVCLAIPFVDFDYLVLSRKVLDDYNIEDDDQSLRLDFASLLDRQEPAEIFISDKYKNDKSIQNKMIALNADNIPTSFCDISDSNIEKKLAKLRLLHNSPSINVLCLK
jgi:hypothetical protein